jgi:hypothetical protein
VSDEKTVRFGYSSSSNITFNGTWDTGIPRSKWAEMSEADRNRELDSALYELIEMWELDDDEPDFEGHWRYWR